MLATRSSDFRVAFPPEIGPFWMRESHPGVARKGFFRDEEDETNLGLTLGTVVTGLHAQEKPNHTYCTCLSGT